MAEYPGKTRGCRACGADTKPLFRHPDAPMLGKVYCKSCTEPVPEPAADRTVIGFAGYTVTTEGHPCYGGCGRVVTLQWASHGGDLMDVDDPLLGYCKGCVERLAAVAAVPPGGDPEALYIDPDDLPFD